MSNGDVGVLVDSNNEDNDDEEEANDIANDNVILECALVVALF